MPRSRSRAMLGSATLTTVISRNAAPEPSTVEATISRPRDDCSGTNDTWRTPGGSSPHGGCATRNSFERIVADLRTWWRSSDLYWILSISALRVHAGNRLVSEILRGLGPDRRGNHDGTKRNEAHERACTNIHAPRMNVSCARTPRGGCGRG